MLRDGRCVSRKISRYEDNVSSSTYTAHLDTMLIESRPLDDISFQGIIDLRYELECQGLQPISIGKGFIDPKI